MTKLQMKNYNIILTKKQQKHQPYHLEKLININILQVKKYYHLIKGDQGRKQVQTIEEHGKQLFKFNAFTENL